MQSHSGRLAGLHGVNATMPPHIDVCRFAVPGVVALPYRYGRAVGYPLEESGEASHNGKRDDFRKLIGVQLADRCLELLVKRGARLDQDGHLLGLLDSPLPTVDGSAFRKHVDARGEPAL